MAALPQQEIANGLAVVYKEFYGRGPTKLVAHISRDAVFCVLEDINTPGQQKLVGMDELALVNAVHSRLQRGMGPEMIAVVERVMGRGVRCYVPGFDGACGVGVDTFLLEPDSAPG
jgi:uncharacterized protein YbcI